MIAPGRARRPGATLAVPDEPRDETGESCPFCAGSEAETPPETLALPEREPPDSAGWQVRVVPNLYPAFDRQEVVVHGPDHVRTFAALDDGRLELVAEAWRRRREAVPGGYLHAFVNEDRAAGASLSHSHSQLVWLDGEPPRVASERRSPCGVCELLTRGRGLEVAERDGVVLVAAWAGRGPYELLVAPREHTETSAFGGGLLAAALQLLAEGIRRLRAVAGPAPWNAWLHDSAHWHLEVLPRLTVLAGVELGAGVYVNPLPPEHAAEELRAAGP